jgi:hypothetical protein
MYVMIFVACSATAVIGGFVVSAIASEIRPPSKRATASRFCRFFGNAILAGICGGAYGWFLDLCESGFGFVSHIGETQPLFAWGWVASVSLVLLHQLIYLWNERHDK